MRYPRSDRHAHSPGPPATRKRLSFQIGRGPPWRTIAVPAETPGHSAAEMLLAAGHSHHRAGHTGYSLVPVDKR